MSKGKPYNQICFDHGFHDWFDSTLKPPEGMTFKKSTRNTFNETPVFGLFHNGELTKIVEPDFKNTREQESWSLRSPNFYN